MKLSLKHIGRTILQLKIETHNTTVIEDVTNLFNFVDDEFIESLREIADELESHNLKIKENETNKTK